MKGKNIIARERKTDKYLFGCTPNTYADALEKAVELINERKKSNGFDINRRYILFVPDKYTLLAEKLLYADGGSFDTEVLTVNRLCFKVAEHDGRELSQRTLSRLGAVLTVRKILGENKDKLRCFNRSALFPGFGETVYDNICQLAASGLTPDDLVCGDQSVTALKLADLKFIYSEYLKGTENKYVDASGRLMLLENMLSDTSYFNGASVFFACYDEFTPLLDRIAAKICSLSDHAVIVGAKCGLNISGRVTEYAASSRADELKAVAVRICNLVRRGVRYGDIGVIAQSADYNRLRRIFDEYGIPFFTDVKYSLSSHPLARYVLDLFSAAKSGTNANYIKLAKNPYSGVDRKDADIFENYVNYCAVSEGSMRFPFTVEPAFSLLENSLDTAEKVRKRVAGLVKKVGSVKSGREFYNAVEQAIPLEEPDITAGFDTAIQNPRQEILAAAEVLGEVFSSQTGFSVLLDALKEGFSLKEVSVIPNLSDTVEVGDVQVFRASKKKYLFAVSVHDGELPCVKADDGILTDKELELITNSGGAVIEPSIEALNRRSEDEFVSVLSASGNLFLSYVEGEPPSPVIARIKRECARRGIVPGFASFMTERETLAGEGEKFAAGQGGEKERKRRKSGVFSAADELTAECMKLSGTAAVLSEIAYGEDALRYANRLRYICPTPAAARELYYIGKCEIESGGSGTGFEPELYAALENVRDKREHDLFVKNARAIYGKRVSVSRVQEYFACPLRCFARYGLKLQKRPDGEVSALDLGTFLHRVIELFVSRGCMDPAVTVPRIVSEISESDPQMLKGASESFIKELTAEATSVAEVVARQLDKGNFAPKYTEAAFGAHAALKGSSLPLSAGTVTLEGVIDRLDVCGNAARVIDYKTGYADFALADIYYGRKIQLAIYLKVAEINGFTPAGMFYFPFSTAFASGAASYRLLGMFDADYAVDMDRDLGSEEYVSDVVNAKSLKGSTPESPRIHKTGAGADGETLRAVCGYAEDVLTCGAEEMLGGYCAPSPLVAGKHTECTYCEMKPVCTSFGVQPLPRRKSGVKAPFIVNCMSNKEENK